MASKLDSQGQQDLQWGRGLQMGCGLRPQGRTEQPCGGRRANFTFRRKQTLPQARACLRGSFTTGNGEGCP